MTNIIIKQAHENDIPIIEEIMIDVVNFLDFIRQPQWERQNVSWQGLSRYFKVDDFYIASIDDSPVGCFALIDFDPTFWPDVAKGTSLFIHKLAVKRCGSKQGVSKALIDFAKTQAVKLGINEVRLDTHQFRDKVRAIYEREGFICVGEKCLCEKYHTAFYIWKAEYNIIHIVGASGAGTTTLGQALEKKYGYTWLDTDCYFWEQTDPPFVKSLPHGERVKRLGTAIKEHTKCVISGSLCGWGDVFIPQFDLVVFVDTPTDVRIERLQKREYERFGSRIRKNGDMYEEHLKFIKWAKNYDIGGLDMRSRALHEKWLKDCPCPVIRVDGTKPVDELLKVVMEEK
ncbi:MAG TPA: GNAT family N-acetyltransferase [Clostridia bacterium]|nr:GNAT family N-acetyltransferase [Clostridia bacterium]